jgi:hypothetical protein
MLTNNTKAFINEQQYGKVKKKVINPFKKLQMKSKPRSK